MYDLSVNECLYKVTEMRGNRKVTLKHYFRLPTLQDWMQYFKGVSELGLSRGKETFEVSDSVQAKNTELWNKLVTRVEGYAIKSKSEYWSERKQDYGNYNVHNLVATAHTRAVNRAISDLVGFGEVSAEEVQASGDIEGAFGGKSK